MRKTFADEYQMNDSSVESGEEILSSSKYLDLFMENISNITCRFIFNHDNTLICFQHSAIDRNSCVCCIGFFLPMNST